MTFLFLAQVLDMLHTTCDPARLPLAQLPYSSVLVVAQAHSLQTQVRAGAARNTQAGAPRRASRMPAGGRQRASPRLRLRLPGGVLRPGPPLSLPAATCSSSIILFCLPPFTPLQVFDATDVVVKSGGHSRVEQGSGAAIS